MLEMYVLVIMKLYHHVCLRYVILCYSNNVIFLEVRFCLFFSFRKQDKYYC